MTASRARFLAPVLLAAVVAEACGAKGPPLAPLRPIPVAVSEFSIEREGAATKLRILIPDANSDGSTPAAVDRIEVYATTLTADAPGPGTTELIIPANLVGTVEVRPAKPPKENAPPDPRPAAGDVTTFIDLTAPAAGSVRYFAAIASASKRRSRTGSILPVSLAEPPAAPANVKIDFTEQKLKLTWDAGSADTRYIIEEANDQGGSSKRISTTPLETAAYEEAVEFGKSRCLIVRAVDAKPGVLIIGAPSQPVCVTPRDKFPPSVPTSFQAVPGDSGVDLVWTAVQASDLAGYIVLRGDGADGTLQPLTSTPVTSSAYRDTTARPGQTYVYAVAAIDKSVPPNRSEPSNKSVVTVR